MFQKYLTKLIIITLLCATRSYGESAPYSPETNSLNTYTSTSGHHPYTKWNAEPPTDSQTFTVQSGYEGYLVPSEPPFTISDIFKTAGLISLLPSLSKIGIKLAFKFGIWALGFLGLFLIGSLFTSAICAFTPICTISFLGFRGFNSESVRSLINQDSLNSAAQFVADAVRKYKKLNDGSKQKPEKNK